MSWVDVPGRGWRDFLSKASDLVEAVAIERPYLCRGQSNAAWSLTPSLLRCFRLRTTQRKLIEVERAALKTYKPEARAFVPGHVLPTDDSDILSWWTIMQHYGAPTRLLDWTPSPYVAAYFAVTGHYGKDGAIWFVNNRVLNEAMGNTEEKDRFADAGPLDEYFLRVGNSSKLHTLKQETPTDRMIAQSGLFTVSERVTDDHAKVIDGALSESGKSDLLYGRLIIRAKDKSEFLLHLHAMGVKASTLFPGIDGVGRSVKEIVELHRTF